MITQRFDTHVMNHVMKWIDSMNWVRIIFIMLLNFFGVSMAGLALKTNGIRKSLDITLSVRLT